MERPAGSSTETTHCLAYGEGGGRRGISCALGWEGGGGRGISCALGWEGGGGQLCLGLGRGGLWLPPVFGQIRCSTAAAEGGGGVNGL
jgi:hypothetical protein